MGLEMTELAMACEEEFNFRIDDDEEFPIVTVADLYNYIMRRIESRADQTCPTLTAFLLFRKTMRLELREPRRRICLTTPLSELFPFRRRWRLWRKAESSLDGLLPSLEARRGDGMALWGLAGVSVLVALSIVFLLPVVGEWPAWLGASVTLIGALSIVIILWAVSYPFLNTVFPSGAVDVRDLIQLMTRNFYSGHPTLTWKTLQRIISERLDVPLESVTMEKEFVKDFGAG